MKNIALIGRPNVGKSSLFNRLAGKRIAITSDISGTTRDTKKEEIEIDDKHALLIDTGGLDDKDEMFEIVKRKSLQSAKESDIILYMVDGKLFPDDKDKKIFFELQKLGKDIALIINKIDNDKMNEIVWTYQSFGIKNIFPISVSHNRGITPLLNWLYKKLPIEENLELNDDEDLSLEAFLDDFKEEEENLKEKLSSSSNEIKVAIVGRVNVGKSSLLNALLNEERAVVSSIAGTTIDPVDEEMIYKDKIITFVDTAGIRKRGKIEGIEKFALNRTEKMLENANIALIVLDASEEFKELDERIASLVDKFSLGSIIVLNKWDKARDEYKKVVEDVRYRFKFLGYSPIITVSALSKKRIHKINDKILEVYENYSRRISTGKLNELIKFANSRHHLPSDMGKIVKIFFATQFDIKPPRIALVMNRPKSLHFSYKRYLINTIREHFNFEGSPILIFPRKRGEKEEIEEN